MDHFKERSTRTYRQKQLFTKEEMALREARCIADEPAFCTAACPLGLDGRAFAALVAEGKTAQARAMLEKSTPFAGILAAGCAAPCRRACRLNEAGDGTDMAALERYVMRHAPRASEGALMRYQKKQTMAVFGDDLFALVSAAVLAAKRYPVQLFTSAADAGTLIREAAPFLVDDLLAAAVQELKRTEIRVEYASVLSAEAVREAAQAHTCVIASAGFGLPEPDAVTLVSEDNILTSSAADVLSAFYDARRAGVSADRLAQRMAPDKRRGQEGPVETHLYTNMDGVAPSCAVAELDGGYEAVQARAEAARCIQCHCDECVRGCAWLRHEGTPPKKLAREIVNNAGIIMGDHMMNRAMNSCALCGQCAAVCPGGFDLGEICRLARENMVETDKLSLAYHEFALRDMLFSNGEAFLARPAPEGRETRYVFFPGCQAAAVAPEATARAYADLLERTGGSCGLLLACCGAMARWAGRTALWQEQADKLRAALTGLGDAVILTACPTCRKELAAMDAGRVQSLWPFLAAGPLPQAARHDDAVVLHDACGARGDTDTQAAVRTLARGLGLTVEEGAYSLDRSGCCGWGGLTSLVNPEVAGEMADAIVCTEPDAIYLSYCFGCRDRLARAGVRSVHLLEWLTDAPAGEVPDLSARRANRLTLKRRLLSAYWKEALPVTELPFDITYTHEARALMESRRILEEDVAAVLTDYHNGGAAARVDSSEALSACRRIGNVTFWVAFVPTAQGYEVRRVWSLRMTVRVR